MEPDPSQPAPPPAVIPAHPPVGPRLHPPTSPGPIDPDFGRRSWPTAIGVVVIALQSIGFLVALGSALTLFIDYTSWVAPFGGAATMDIQRAWRPAMLASHGASAVLSIIAIVGAILLLQRLRIAVLVLLLWAALRVPHALVAGWLAGMMQRQTMSVIPPTAGRGPPPAAFGDMMFWFTILMSVLWLLILPAFLMFWFLAPSIRRQTKLWR